MDKKVSDIDIIEKARELGLPEEEIAKFIENQKIAKKYGFDGEYSSINVKIDKNINLNSEALDDDKEFSKVFDGEAGENHCCCGHENCECGSDTCSCCECNKDHKLN